jgi:hypothetical protein
MADNGKFDENLKPREAAAILRVTTGHLANARSRGAGPPYLRAEGRILYPSNLLREYISERIVDPARRAG